MTNIHIKQTLSVLSEFDWKFNYNNNIYYLFFDDRKISRAFILNDGSVCFLGTPMFKGFAFKDLEKCRSMINKIIKYKNFI